jgi:hypothetical protein
MLEVGMNIKIDRIAFLFALLMLAVSACGRSATEPQIVDVVATDTPTHDVDVSGVQDDQMEDDSLPTQDPLAIEDVEPEPTIDGSSFWSEAHDERTGVRFAVPCFWEVNLPESDPGGLGAFSIRNYNEEFVLAHPRSHISEDEGAIKIDMIYLQPSTWDLSVDTSLDEFAQSLTDDEFTELLTTEEVLINGQNALLVTNRDKRDDSINQYHLFGVSTDLILLFNVWPQSTLAAPDVQGVLDSIALTPKVSVQVPQILPMDPPLGVPATCLKRFESTSADLTGTLSCQGIEADSAEAVACATQDALFARDMQTLASLMSDPFTIGYWGSEGGFASPMDAVNELSHNRLPADTRGLTFTTDRSRFPPLQGIPPERMFGPDVDVALIIYSEGWGGDGDGAALLYIAQDGGVYTWHSMVYSHVHFDR